MSLDMKERMLSGKPCLSFDKVLEEEKQHQQRLQFKFNHLDPDDSKGRIALLKEMLGEQVKECGWKDLSTLIMARIHM